jgi:hypothetical protein
MEMAPYRRYVTDMLFTYRNNLVEKRLFVASSECVCVCVCVCVWVFKAITAQRQLVCCLLYYDVETLS